MAPAIKHGDVPGNSCSYSSYWETCGGGREASGLCRAGPHPAPTGAAGFLDAFHITSAKDISFPEENTDRKSRNNFPSKGSKPCATKHWNSRVVGPAVSPHFVIAVTRSRGSRVDPKRNNPTSMNPCHLEAQTLFLATCKVPKPLLSAFQASSYANLMRAFESGFILSCDRKSLNKSLELKFRPGAMVPRVTTISAHPASLLALPLPANRGSKNGSNLPQITKPVKRRNGI